MNTIKRIPSGEALGIALPGASTRLDKYADFKAIYDTIAEKFSQGTTVARYICDDADGQWHDMGKTTIDTITESHPTLKNPHHKLYQLILEGPSLLETIQADLYGGNAHKVAVYTKSGADWLYIMDDFHNNAQNPADRQYTVLKKLK